ncbi:MAG TPA: DUF4398 domain-containing protein [Anaeromyxobacteraceae bacterium]
MRPLLLLALVATLPGCAQIHSNLNLVDAEVAIEGARAAGAAKSAPYEYTAAEAYLHKAREELGYAQYGAAAELARESQELAERAHQKATDAGKAGDAR